MIRSLTADIRWYQLLDSKGASVVISRVYREVAWLIKPGVAPTVARTEFIPSEKNMDTRFAAAYLGYSPATLRLWRRKGGGPRFYSLGRFIKYSQEDLDSWSGGSEILAVRRAARRMRVSSSQLRMRSARQGNASQQSTPLEPAYASPGD
jgi:helix-turn-helix protein